MQNSGRPDLQHCSSISCCRLTCAQSSCVCASSHAESSRYAGITIRCSVTALFVQAEKRKQKLDDIRALKQKEVGPKLLAALPLDQEPEKELAPVARNSVCWGAFMATSANVRYQLLNGFEERYLVRRRSCQRISKGKSLPVHPTALALACGQGR